MRQAIEDGFYRQFCKRFASHPTKPAQQARLPKFWLFPDRPCFKNVRKTLIREMQFNSGGIHVNGIMMTAPVSRFRGNVMQLIEEKCFCVQGIDRIHVMPTTYDLDRLADYAGKTLKWDHEAAEHVIILPDNRVKKPVRVLSPEERVVRDIQAQHNVSDEIAGFIASKVAVRARNRVTDRVTGP